MGSKPDGSDSYAYEVAPREHWPDIHALICVVSDDKKGTSSTSGMQRTVETSPLLQHRIKHVVPQRMADISAAIKARDFDAFARITMADSNQFHAVCLDTDPPIFYMNDVSRAIIAAITEYNRVSVAAGGKLKAAYTYDAGPNAVIYAPKENIPEIVQLIVHYFPQAEKFKDPFGLFGTAGVGEGKLVAGFNELVAKRFPVGSVKGLIHTRVGDGPRVLGEEEALLGANGFPKELKA
jgi:diphosphomevalonate decarboxylase